MSILIKGMEMPKNEELIIICSDGTVEMTNNDGSRVCEQKAIELPPHGDLIDRDALNIDISKSVVFTVAKNRPSAEMRGAFKVLDRLEIAPTIIESEE